MTDAAGTMPRALVPLRRRLIYAASTRAIEEALRFAMGMLPLESAGVLD